MASISKSLGRTVKTNIILYSTDNKGRDGYITYNDGGFWKDNIKPIKLKANYPIYINKTFHSLIHQSAPFNYYSDGRGRDTYVLKDNAGLVKEFNPLAKRQILSSYLRRNDFPFSYDKKIKNQKFFLTPSDKENYFKIHDIQKNVIDRLYDQCLEKFREKMKCKSPLTKDSINNLNNSNNIMANTVSESSLLSIDKKRRINHKFNDRMTKKIMKFKLNKTHKNLCFNKDNKKNNFQNLKIQNTSDNNLVNYFGSNETCKNSDIKNTFNCLSSGNNWNPIISKYNSINNYQREKMATCNNEYNKKKKIGKSELNHNDLSENIKNNTIRNEFQRERPKSQRRLFQKKQIFNTFKPYLVDDFQEYSDYE